jgi:hypothetical protein
MSKSAAVTAEPRKPLRRMREGSGPGRRHKEFSLAEEFSTPDLSQSLLGLYRNGQTHLVAWESGPPPRIDGYVIGTPVMARSAPHNGEMHPDGDEVLFLISGRLDVVLEED